MEASKFGFGEDVSPAFKFDPTDADLVANYLLPRAVDLPDLYPRAIIDDDTLSLPPWELLHKHGHGTSDHAFFFEPRNGRRKERTVKGGAGMWRGQRRENHTITLLKPGGGELDLEYSRYNLTFYHPGEKSKVKTGGWAMYEYHITSPPLPNTMLTRINRSHRSKNDMQQQLLPHAEAESSSYQVAVVDPLTPPPQPGPSYDYDAVMADGDEQGDALLMEDIQWQQTGEVEAVVADQNFFPVHEHMATSYHPGGVMMTSAVDAGQTGDYYTPLPADQDGVYGDGYGEYQEGFPCPDQEQHHAGDCGSGGGETGDYVVHCSLDPFEGAATAEYDEHGGDEGDQPNPPAGSCTAVTGASEGHGGRGETTHSKPP